MKSNMPDGWVKRDGVLEEMVPRNATSGLRSTGGLGAWVWTARQQLTAGLGADFIPHAAHLAFRVVPQVVGVMNAHIEIEITTGAGFVPYGYLTHGMSGFTQNALIASGHTVPLGPSVIPAGTRIDWRIRDSNANMLIDAGIYIAGYEPAPGLPYWPYQLYPHLAGVHAAQALVTPIGGFLVAPAANWAAWSIWVQVLAPAAVTRDLLFWGGSWFHAAMGNQSGYVQLGTGPVGNEQERATVGFASAGMVGNCGTQWLRRPMLVKVGERVAYRVLGNISGGEMRFFYTGV